MTHRPQPPPPRGRPPGLGRWLLGGRDSWRRVVLTGVGAGVALAFVAALAAALIDSRGGAVDKGTPTPAPAVAPADDGAGDVLPPPEETPPAPPEEGAPPTEPPPTEPPLPTEPPPTEPPPEPTATPVMEAPTPEPTATMEGGP